MVQHDGLPVSESEKATMAAIKSQAFNLLEHLDRIAPGREKSLAVTKLEECVMWAVKGVTA